MAGYSNAPWNGIPDDPDKSGWHWIGYPHRMEASYWSAAGQAWVNPRGWGGSPFTVSKVEYLGPCQPPVTRCRDGSKMVAVSARIIRDHDQIGITMNDGSTHYLDGYYWRDDQPVIDIVGKTIPEINAAADEYRRPKQEEPA